jgi:hypothetical protein
MIPITAIRGIHRWVTGLRIGAVMTRSDVFTRTMIIRRALNTICLRRGCLTVTNGRRGMGEGLDSMWIKSKIVKIRNLLRSCKPCENGKDITSFSHLPGI